MARRATGRPTDGELAILRVLWERGPSTVREVNDALGGGEAPGYTTTLKIMQIMTEKGLVVRDETNRSHVYRAAIAEKDAQGRLVRDLLEKAFGGSAEKLVVRALSAKKVSREELQAIRRLLDEVERRARS